MVSTYLDANNSFITLKLLLQIKIVINFPVSGVRNLISVSNSIININTKH